jgi:hypothetical protein
MSIVTAALLGEYLAGALVVLMLSGGEALEGYAVRSASSVLRIREANTLGGLPRAARELAAECPARRFELKGNRELFKESSFSGRRRRRSLDDRAWKLFRK